MSRSIWIVSLSLFYCWKWVRVTVNRPNGEFTASQIEAKFTTSTPNGQHLAVYLGISLFGWRKSFSEHLNDLSHSGDLPNCSIRFLTQITKRSIEVGFTIDKACAIIGHCKKAFQCCLILRSITILNCLYFFRIHLDAIASDDEAPKFDASLSKSMMC